MVVMLAFVKLVNGLATLKMTSGQNIGLLKLSQHPVNSGQTHVGLFFKQDPENIFGRHVPLVAILKNLEDFQPGQGDLEPVTFEFINLGHADFPILRVSANPSDLTAKCCQYNAPIISLSAISMFETIARRVRLGGLGVVALALCACSTVDSASNRLASVVTPYKIDIVQGNFVSREQLAALKPGMPRAQVRDILGTPLLNSVFHADRWDYVFTFKRQGVEPQSRRVTAFFKDELLDRTEADALPSEAEFVSSLDSGRKLGAVPVLEMSEDALKAGATTAKPAESKPALPALPTSYPPLEAAKP